MGDWISSLVSGLFSLGSAGMAWGAQAQTNKANQIMQRETNQHNQLMQAQANQAQHSEAQLAYDRSKATNQVALMQNAGMTKGAALNALTGGGSYTPAPQSASVDQAPKNDATGFMKAAELVANGASNIAQRIDEMKRFNEANRIAVEEAEKQRQHELQKQREQNLHDEKMRDKDLSQQLDIFNTQFQQQVKEFNESVRQWEYINDEDKRRWEYFAHDQLRKLQADANTQEAISKELSAKSDYMADKWKKLFEYSDSDGSAVGQEVKAMVADWKQKSRDEEMDDNKAIDEMVDSLDLNPQLANLLKFALKTALRGLWQKAQKSL